MTDPKSGAATERDGTVLIVDDEPEMAELFAAWVGRHHEVETAHDGQQALEAMTNGIDVVVLDRRMPVMDGDALLQAMAEAGHDAQVVMVTAVDPGSDSVGLPFDDYLTKPVTRDVLLGVVDRMLRLQRAGDTVRECHSLERRRDILRTATVRGGDADPEAFDLLTRRLEAAAKDAGAGLAWLKEEYCGVDGTGPGRTAAKPGGPS
jgi:two-component system response regulator AdeR